MCGGCARRARATRKFPGLKTWIGTLGQYDRRSRKRAWTATSQVWLKQNCLDDMTDADEDEATVKWKGAFSVYLDRASGFRENTWVSLEDTTMFARAEQVRLGRGLCMLSQCRTNGFRTGKRRHSGGLIINGKYKRICPCCSTRREKGETVEHLLTECQRWKEERERCKGDIVRDTLAVEPVEQKGTVILLLGGKSSGRRLTSWLPSPSTTSEAVTSGAFRVARFLQFIRSGEAAILRQIPHKKDEVESMFPE